MQLTAVVHVQDFVVYPSMIQASQLELVHTISDWRSLKGQLGVHDKPGHGRFEECMQTLKSTEVISLLANLLEYLHCELVPNSKTPRQSCNPQQNRRYTLFATTRRTPTPPPILLRRSPAISSDSQGTRTSAFLFDALRQVDRN